MTNHPNRSRRGNPAANPAPDDVRAARQDLAMTQADAAALIYCQPLAWARWEAGDRAMHPAFWELWKIKSRQLAQSR